MTTHETPQSFASLSEVEQASLMFSTMREAKQLSAALKVLNSRVAALQSSLRASLSTREPDHQFIKCPLGHLSLQWRAEPEVDDQAAFHSHILATGELDLLQNRVSVSAVRERWEIGDEVPGIKRRDVQELKVTPTIER